MRICVHKCPHYFARRTLALCAKLYLRYSRHCRQDKNTIHFYFVLVTSLDFRFSFSIVNDNTKCFRQFRHRFRRH